jgi:hypothetical protein
MNTARALLPTPARRLSRLAGARLKSTGRSSRAARAPPSANLISSLSRWAVMNQSSATTPAGATASARGVDLAHPWESLLPAKTETILWLREAGSTGAANSSSKDSAVAAAKNANELCALGEEMPLLVQGPSNGLRRQVRGPRGLQALCVGDVTILHVGDAST